ncbi:UPF0280 family protein [Shimia sp.]|uniref:UPF0280 family protein n=1 Tax=Shimia sp. TaxID=1954381 RepID=UPI0032998B4F
MNPTAAILPCGKRLHLQHGPIDLIISADGQRDRAFEAANARFQTILTELVTELGALKQPMSPTVECPMGDVAQRMHVAAITFSDYGFLTRMAAVAGSVADTVLEAMIEGADLRRAYVNNGGDIALHLQAGERYSSAMASHDGSVLGQIIIQRSDNVGGIATSGRHGRSLSCGIADSVTVLSTNAANADVAATLIANAVDLADHSAISRRPANEMVDASDLEANLVVTDCGLLAASDRTAALRTGLDCALTMVNRNTIHGAALFLQGEALATDTNMISPHTRTKEYA